MQGEALNFFTHDWITGVFLIWSVMFMSLWLNFRKRLRAAFTNFVSEQYQNFYGRDERLLFNPYNLIAGTMFFLSLSLVIFLSLKELEKSDLLSAIDLNYLFILSVLLIYYIAKSLIIRGIGWALNRTVEAKLFLFGRYAFLQTISMVLMAFMGLYFFLPAFNKFFFFLGLALGAILFAWSSLRLILRAVQLGWLNLKYIFLYICAFEIAPLIIVYFRVLK